MNTSADIILVWFIFAIATIFVVIVLLNLLIAIMGDTFGRVLENITNLSMREKAMLVAENETLFNRTSLFSNAQYLIIIKEKNLDSLQAENWDGQMNGLKRQLLEKMTFLQTDLDSKITENQKDLKKRFIDQDERGKRQFSQIEGKITTSVKGDLEGVFSKVNELFNNLNAQLAKQQGTIYNLQDSFRTVRTLQDKVDGLMIE